MGSVLPAPVRADALAASTVGAGAAADAAPADLEALRHEVRDGRVRIGLGEMQLELRRAQLEPQGIVFGAGDVRGFGAIPALVLVATVGQVEGFSTEPDATLFRAVLVGMGAASGAVVGAGLGALAHHWKLVWQRETKRRDT